MFSVLYLLYINDKNSDNMHSLIIICVTKILTLPTYINIKLRFRAQQIGIYLKMNNRSFPFNAMPYKVKTTVNELCYSIFYFSGTTFVKHCQNKITG